MGKLVEKEIFDQVYNHFVVNEIFHPNHHGFLKNHSTSTALIQLYNMWLEAAEDQKLSASLLLDLSAAFDIVDHKIFLKKLAAYNFSPQAIQWFNSYLSGRSQTVQVESKFSASVQIGDYSVPQGSILGPLIFIIFNNDFPHSSIEGESVLYADDDTDVVADSDPEALEAKLQREAIRSADWVSDNRMVCAGDKTKLLVVGTKKLRNNKLESKNKKISVNVCGTLIEESKSEKLLGVIVSEDLSWNKHLYGEQWRDEDNAIGLIPQLSQRVGLLSLLVHRLTSSGFNAVSNGLFNSKLNYCLEVIGNIWGYTTHDLNKRRFSAFSKNDCHRLQVLQNKVLRLKTGLDYDTSTQKLLSTSKDMSVHQLISYHTLLSVYKTLANQKPTYIYKRFNSTKMKNDRLRRNCFNLNVQGDLTVTRGGFLYRGSKLYNMLPPEFKTISNYETFKSKIKIWIRKPISIKP